MWNVVFNVQAYSVDYLISLDVVGTIVLKDIANRLYCINQN